MKSSDAVFTRQNPFPPEPLFSKSYHYSPSRVKKIPKKQEKLALSPVRFGLLTSSPEPLPQPASLSLEDQSFLEGSPRGVLCSPPSEEQRLPFSESWSSTDLASAGASSSSEHHSLPQNSSAAAGTQEPSVLAKYVQRFRYGRPQSREERQKFPAGQADLQPLWWVSSSPPEPSNPTQTSKERFREPSDYRSEGMCGSYDQVRSDALSTSRDLIDLSALALSDSSHCEAGEPEILQLQERASRLLEKSENSVSSGSSGLPISSEGLGCSDFSSPVSVDEPVRRPIVSSVVDSSLLTAPSLSFGPSFPVPATLSTTASHTRPEDDILFQWRLRRKMEEARQWSQTSHSSAFHQAWSGLPSLVSADPPGRAGFPFTPAPVGGQDSLSSPAVCSALQPTGPACPVSSPAVCKLQPETSIQTHDYCSTCSHSVPFSPPGGEQAALRPQCPCTFPQAPQTRQSSSSRTSVQPCRKHQTFSSPSPQPSESTEGEQQGCQCKHLQAKDKPGVGRGGKKTSAPVRNKKSNRIMEGDDGVKRSQRAVKASHGRASDGRGSVGPVSVGPNSDGPVSDGRVSDQHSRGQKRVGYKTKETSRENRSHSRSHSSAGDVQSGDQTPAPSPIHSVLGQRAECVAQSVPCFSSHQPQVVSEVLFPGVDSSTQSRTPCSDSHVFSDSPGFSTPTPPQSPAPPPPSRPPPSEIIDQLMQEAEESDGLEFEDDPLLSVLRQQRKWVKEQLCEVDGMLEKLQED